MINWFFWNINYFHEIAFQISKFNVSFFSNIDVCDDWFMWCCVFDSWIQNVQFVTNDEKSFFLYFKKNKLFSVWNFVLYSKSLIFAHKKKLILTNVILKIRFFENSYFDKFNLWNFHLIFHILIVCVVVIQLMNYLNVFNYVYANFICSFFWIMHICWVWRFWLLKQTFKRWLYNNEKNHMIWLLLIIIDICHNYFI